MISKTLLLNASYAPIHFVTVKRAIVLVMQAKAEIVTKSTDEYRSEKRAVPVPSVIRLLHFVKIPYKSKVKLSKKALIARDNGLCGYCSKPGENIDHIVPRARGGKHTWLNVVWSCRSCNDKKADKLLAEIGMTLKIKPYEPKEKMELILAVGKVELQPEWVPYLAVA